MGVKVVQQIIGLIIVFNFIVLIGLVVILRLLKSQGKLNERKFAILLIGYFSFSFITTSLPILIINVRATLIINIFFLLVLWVIGYPWCHWLYRKFSSRNSS